MATERENCIDNIAKRTGRDRGWVEDVLSDLDERASQKAGAGGDRRKALNDAGQEMLDQMGIDAAAGKRADVMDAQLLAAKNRQARKLLKDGVKGHMILAAEINGVNAPFEGSRDSTWADYKGLLGKYVGNFNNDLERAGLNKLFASRAIEREWNLELEQLTRGKSGKPGVSGSKQALEIAETVHRWAKVSIQDGNDAGAWTRFYAGYIGRTAHDADLIRTGGKTAQRGLWRERMNLLGARVTGDAAAIRMRAEQLQNVARDRWIAMVKREADMPRTFGSLAGADLDNVLRDLWRDMATGEHYEIMPREEDGSPVVNMARQASAHREIHWKDANAWRRYVAEYSQESPTAIILSSFDRAARRTALMQHFGTKPREGFRGRMAHIEAQLKDDPTALREFQGKRRFLENMYNELDFSAHKPASQLWNNIANGTMAMNRWSKLDRVTFTHLASLPFKGFAGQKLGMNLAERWNSIFSGLLRGAEGSAKRQIADMTLFGSVYRQRRMLARYNGEPGWRSLLPGRLGGWKPGEGGAWISKIDANFFNLTGVHGAVENQQEDYHAMVARHLGMQRDKPWNEMASKEARGFLIHGIDEPAWKALHATEWTNVEGQTALLPSDAYQIPDEAIVRMIRERSSVSQRALAAPITEEAIRKARNDIANKLAAYLYDEGQFAVPNEVSPRVRAIMYQGTQQNAPNLYKALQLMYQFKIWPLDMIDRIWGRWLYGGDGALDKMGQVVELAVAATVFGTLSEMMRDAVKLQNPLARLENDPASVLLAGFLRSGMATIMGDYLFGEYDRHGHSILQQLAGPTVGQLGDLWDLKREFLDGLMKGKWAPFQAGLAHDVRQNLPFVDMWWTFKAFDYLVMYQLLEWINPGYINRMESRMRRQQGIEFMLSPSAAVGR